MSYKLDENQFTNFLSQYSFQTRLGKFQIRNDEDMYSMLYIYTDGIHMFRNVYDDDYHCYITKEEFLKTYDEMYEEYKQMDPSHKDYGLITDFPSYIGRKMIDILRLSGNANESPRIYMYEYSDHLIPMGYAIDFVRKFISYMKDTWSDDFIDGEDDLNFVKDNKSKFYPYTTPISRPEGCPKLPRIFSFKEGGNDD